MVDDDDRGLDLAQDLVRREAEGGGVVRPHRLVPGGSIVASRHNPTTRHSGRRHNKHVRSDIVGQRRADIRALTVRA